MAVPRIFVSSTCHDLHEIRFQLRQFIDDIGYDPVMSEFGDIFYNLNSHVQDACKEEVSKCNLFILIVGNNYGSIYHSHKDRDDLPDSVTLQEFRKALEVGIPKYIFINKFVQHDFENYRRALSKHTSKQFASNKIEDEDAESVRKSIKSKYDEIYPFPNESYKYVFYFLDILYNIDINNAIYSFESFDEVKETLRKQWAGFFHDALTKNKTVSLEKVEAIEQKLNKIEQQLRLLVDSKTTSSGSQNISIDVTKLVNELNVEDLDNIQSQIKLSLDDILTNGLHPRLKINKRFSPSIAKEWLDGLGGIVANYKWSQTVSINEIVNHVDFVYWKNRQEVPYRSLFDLYSIYSKFSPEDQDALAITVSTRFNEYYEEKKAPEKDEDIPF
ncbi:MAG TPA: DUF4062 domain-containing protein [Geothrix sp.]|jgi:hypothetical protein